MKTDEYVPSEDDMRHAYWLTRMLDHHADVDAAFDRFLAQVRRDAWEEGYDAAAEFYDIDTCLAADNPYEETPND